MMTISLTANQPGILSEVSKAILTVNCFEVLGSYLTSTKAAEND